MTNVLLRLSIALLPLLLSLLFAWLTMEGRLNFGAGEKDVFLALPLLLWSLLFLVCSLALWWRKAPLGRMLRRAAAYSTLALIALWLALAALLWWHHD